LVQTTSTEISPTITIIPVATPVSCLPRQNNSYDVALGDPVTISGRSPTPNITIARVWVFGKNTIEITNVSIGKDGSFNYTLNGQQTKDQTPGTYHIIIQYPQRGTSFTILPRFEEDRQGVFDPEGHLLFSIQSIHEKKVDGIGAAETLEQEIMKPGITDTYTNATLILEEPWIQINPLGNHTIGDKFTINVTTNLAVGNELIYSLNPVDYRQPKNIRPDIEPPTGWVNEGLCGNNSWSFDVDSSTFSPKEYWLYVGAVRQNAGVNQRFFMSAAASPGTAQNKTHL
jgi:trimeric autotransporter adhesin